MPLTYFEAVLPLDLPCGRVGADPLPEAGHQVADGLRRGHDVERRGQGALVVEVAEPQLGPGELPLLVLMVLSRREGEGVRDHIPWESKVPSCSGK